MKIILHFFVLFVVALYHVSTFTMQEDEQLKKIQSLPEAPTNQVAAVQVLDRIIQDFLEKQRQKQVKPPLWSAQ